MQLLSASSSTPFVAMSTVNAGNECYLRTNNSNSNGISDNRFRKKKLSEDLLKADFVEDTAGNPMIYPMVLSAPTYIKTEHLQELEHKQQGSNLLSEMFTKNIFNSHSAMFVYSEIPQISSVQSFIGSDTSVLVADASSEKNSLFVYSNTGISFDPSDEDPCPYEANFDPGQLFSAVSAVEDGSMATLTAPTMSLEGVVNSKKGICQLRQHNRIEGFDSSHEFKVLGSMFLNHSYVPLVRGRSFGGNNCRPPKEPLIPGTRYVAAHLRLENNTCEDMCLPEWNKHELEDSRRIIRIERRYQSNEIVASFSIVGSAKENPQTKPSSDPDVKVLEVSCLKCFINGNESDEQFVTECQSDEAHYGFTELPKQNFSRKSKGCSHKMANNTIACQYYITSVEVIKIIELLVGGYTVSDPRQRRKERGRVRSNLAQFWSKHLVSSSKKTMKRPAMLACNEDYLAELEQRINTYDVRKPRLFDKSVKILEWPNLGPALQRAIQSYYMVQLEESSN
ncbi:Hypothetical protein PP7435_CHR2-0001 [Komagataella phaffii CBS 7435]|uniref:DUF7082 domain-containing protein n=2 Tax=Komagataella phaffii TaxID=460519 RepID=C4R359_KOMPG|nr:Hypothetical protein PAS_chr2-2_0003 [Komagataella phaffii GS115]AOA61950.1 GQ67_01352T0 [Komagataella phaffii]CAH2447504.1 Hypothetical protein BQ9382_C2-0005 [Komagataella phaffii CBS 7435]AOA67130.1 GQ68_00038T0 [Komagataella phaffii GS115]CAY69933.1 Hypothetical protein PAS_chr2-2_0003 [Komagataella phaffii GS115]CCA37701.1 Hypothetical protein PP7435_CHR2-0001 [Komagataella phaffii CBS 7435]